MRRIWVALRVFFATLFSARVAAQVETLLSAGGETPEPVLEKTLARSAEAAPKITPKPSAPRPVRSEALTLLATLQREARLVDFLQESLDEYSDAQVGAAVRDVHRQSRQVLERMFALRPIMTEPEGAAVEIAPGFDAAKYRLTGNVAGQGPYRGQLAHHGWEAARCDVPSWSGGKEAAMVVAPAEVEVRA